MTDTLKLSGMQNEEDNFERIIKLLEFPIGHTMQSCSVNNDIGTYVHGPTLNRELSASKYYYRKSKKVLHFTSLKAAYSMINEKSLRLYNLHNSADTDEYTFIGNPIRPFYHRQGYNEIFINAKIDDLKDTFFILSTTSVDELENSKFWKEYGDNGKGVAIEFEILNDPIDWDGFHFSPVFYGESDNWGCFLEQMTQTCEQNPRNRYDFSFDMLYCLHKSALQTYIDEKEIRILAQRPKMNGFVFDAFVTKDIGKDGFTAVKYLQLPLFAEKDYTLSFSDQINEINQTNLYGHTFTIGNFADYLNRIPKIKISKVYVCRDFPLADDKYDEFVRSFSDLVYDKLGYSLELMQMH